MSEPRTRGSKQLRSWFRNDASHIIRSGGHAVMPPSFGKAFFVNPDHARAIDSNNPGTDPSKPLATIAAGYDLMTSGNDDIIYCSSESTHNLDEMLTVDKSRVHFAGMGPLRRYGQGCKISLGSTVAATDIATILNTGVRNSFTNIKFINNNDVAEGIYCFVDGGEYLKLDHCEVYKSTDLDVTGAAEFVANGDSGQYHNCTFGSLADARSGAVVRAAVLFTAGIGSGSAVARDNEFIDCNFWIQCTNTGNRFVFGASGNDVERLAGFYGCKFICNGLSSQIPAQNVAFGSALTRGSVLLDNCVALNAGTAMSTTTGVFVNGPNQTSAAGDAEIGIALQAA